VPLAFALSDSSAGRLVTPANQGRRLVQVVVRGRVQGVSYRAWIVTEAKTRGIDGWVRNRADGAVEAIIAGAPDAIDAMIAACGDGPSLALVTDVIAIEATEDPGAGFRIRA